MVEEKMKKLRKIACVFSALAIIWGLSGCSDGGSSGESPEQTTIKKILTELLQ